MLLCWWKPSAIAAKGNCRHVLINQDNLSAKKVPIKIIANLSHLPIDQFWIEAEKNGWAYLYHVDGKKMLPPKCFTELLDDPNRYFAAQTARKYTSNGEHGFVSKGAEYPLWVKIDKDIPFIEFQIANALYKENFIYDLEKMKDTPEVLEHARQILVQANIPGLRVISSRVHHQDISIEEILHSSKEEAQKKSSKSKR